MHRHACHGQVVGVAADLESSSMLTPTSNVAILGFATRTAAFAQLLAPRGCALRAWDPRLATGGSALATRIEAAGVDVVPELSLALRGARLVVLDSQTGLLEKQVPLQVGQRLLDLATAPASDIESILAALGVPSAAANWRQACAARPDLATAEPPAVRRGELP